MSASRPVSTSDPGVPAPGDVHFQWVGANCPLHAEDDDFGQHYTLWEKFLTHTDASTWPTALPADRTAP